MPFLSRWSLVLLTAGAAMAADAAPLSPQERAVFQRQAEGFADVPIACPWTGAATAAIEVQVVDRQRSANVLPWKRLPSQVQEGRITAKVHLTGGWYHLDLRVADGAATAPMGSVDRVGVGEVFITCGQSNSANHGKPRQTAQDDRVSARDFKTGAWQHSEDPQPGASGNGGSPWALLGDLLVKRLEVPVGVICVGVGSTQVADWVPGGKCAPRLKAAVQLAGPQGLRAVLWHQGESDSINGTSAADYTQRLTTVIQRARADAGWDMPWGIAHVSYVGNAKATPANQQAVLDGQAAVIAQMPGVFAGPATNDFHTRHLTADGVHFNAEGLAAHAAGWFAVLDPRLPPVITR